MKFPRQGEELSIKECLGTFTTAFQAARKLEETVIIDSLKQKKEDQTAGICIPRRLEYRKMLDTAMSKINLAIKWRKWESLANTIVTRMKSLISLDLSSKKAHDSDQSQKHAMHIH